MGNCNVCRNAEKFLTLDAVHTRKPKLHAELQPRNHTEKGEKEYQNCNPKETKRELNARNTCYHALRNILTYRLPHRNLHADGAS